jgi:hypothetical protein
MFLNEMNLTTYKENLFLTHMQTDAFIVISIATRNLRQIWMDVPVSEAFIVGKNTFEIYA